jgi:hypothetical protein
MGGDEWRECPMGTYSTLLSLTDQSQCPPCPSNYVCEDPSTIEPCPPHTHSLAGSYTKLACACDPGYTCTYHKAVHVNVTMPLTVSQFESLRDQFIQAVAAAAGVDPSMVSIIGVHPHAARRLLDANSSLNLTIVARIRTVKRILVARLSHRLTMLGIPHTRPRWRHAHNVSVHVKK